VVSNKPSSYSFCAKLIVLFPDNPILLAPSCCKVEVVYGGGGVRRISFLVTSETVNSLVFKSASMALALSSVSMLVLAKYIRHRKV